MLKKEKEERELTIDWRHLSLSLLRKAWLIVITGILFGMFSIFYNSFFVAPKYSSSVLLYVNNKSLSLGQIDVSMSASDLSASQSLIDTYIVILNSRETLEEVAELAGVEYSYEQIKGMVTTAKKEGTEIFEVIVTTEDPYEAQHIAACISEILPDRIEEIIDGSSMRIVDEAVVNTSKVAPSITRSAIKAFAIGVLIMILAVSVWAIVDPLRATVQNLKSVGRTTGEWRQVVRQTTTFIGLFRNLTRTILTRTLWYAKAGGGNATFLTRTCLSTLIKSTNLMLT